MNAWKAYLYVMRSKIGYGFRNRFNVCEDIQNKDSICMISRDCTNNDEKKKTVVLAHKKINYNYKNKTKPFTLFS